jgi:hypothetical protein
MTYHQRHCSNPNIGTRLPVNNRVTLSGLWTLQPQVFSEGPDEVLKCLGIQNQQIQRNYQATVCSWAEDKPLRERTSLAQPFLSGTGGKGRIPCLDLTKNQRKDRLEANSASAS